MPQQFIVQAVLRAVESLPAFPRLSVLDLSCGDGEILLRLPLPHAVENCQNPVIDDPVCALVPYRDAW